MSILKVLTVVLFFSGVCAQNESDRDMYEDSDDEENGENDTHEAFLVAESDFADHTVEEILGDKKNTKWLLVDNQYICHKHSKSIDDEITFWECKFRRSEKCPFKMATETLETGGPHTITYMYKPETHICFQDPLDAMRQKFRSTIKTTMANNFKAKYSEVYSRTKMEVINAINDPDLKERVRHNLPTEKSLRSAAHNAKNLPTAPKNLEDIDLEVLNRENLNIDEYLIGADRQNGS